MATINVPVTKIAELLGLDPATDTKTVMETMDRVVSEFGASQTASRHRQDDEHVVAAAIAEGRVAPSRKAFWLNALTEDRDGARRVLASLAAGLRPDGTIAAHSQPVDVETADKNRVFKLITGQTDPSGPSTPTIRREDMSPRPVAAASAPIQPTTPLRPAPVPISDPVAAHAVEVGPGALIAAGSEDQARDMAVWWGFGRRMGVPRPGA